MNEVPSDKDSLLHSSNEEELQINFKTMNNYMDGVGYNSFHYLLIVIVCLIYFVDGSEMIIVNLLLTSIEKEWNLDKNSKSLLSSAVFFGFFFGSLLSGYFCNKFGRKWPSVFGVAGMWICTSSLGFTPNYLAFFAARLIGGFSIGIAVPATTTIVTESIPTKNRSFVLNILWILYPLGIIFVCYVSIQFIQGDNLNWRKICKINSLSGIFVLLLSFLLPESPRYLIVKEDYENGWKLLTTIGLKSNVTLSPASKMEIIKDTVANIPSLSSNFDVKGFVSHNFRFTSALLMFLWYSTSLISYGILYILPQIFEKIYKHDRKASVEHMIVAMIILIPCPPFRGGISEISWLGRKKAILIGLLGSIVACAGCIVDFKRLFVYSGLIKFFVNSSMGVISVYTSEIYPTRLRTLSLGFGNALIRLGGITAPFICEYVNFYLPIKGTFVFFIVISGLSLIVTLLLPYETIGAELDTSFGKDLGQSQTAEEIFIEKEKNICKS